MRGQMAESSTDRNAAAIERLAEGQAALWLVESLILALVDAGVLDTDRVLEAVDVVVAAKRAMAAEGRDPEIESASAALLASISTSIAAAKQRTADVPAMARPGRSRRSPRGRAARDPRRS